MSNWRNRLVTVTATAALTLTSSPLLAQAASAEDDGKVARDDSQLLLVHGYGDADKENGKSCNGGVWKDALSYYTDPDAGNRDRNSITTVGYYQNNTNCDEAISKADNSEPIQEIAKDLANYIDEEYSSNDKSVNIVAHSMGGLVTRVALLGSAQGWDGFPSKLDVNNVVTLGTPHQGVSNPSVHDTRQWNQMDNRDGKESGFMERLHQDDLSGSWASGTDWSLVGSTEDGTVNYNSAIDKGNPADQKYGYYDNGGKIDHSKIRELRGGTYTLRYWHSSGDHDPHETDNGWAPLKTAFKAATNKGDDLPK